MYFLKCIIFITLIFLGINDIILNRKRDKFLKIIEFIICAFFVFLLFSTVIEYQNLKSEIKNRIENDKLMGSQITEYNLNGTVGETISIGEYMVKHFVKNIYDGRTNISPTDYLKNNIKIVVITCIYIIYWITLLLLYEKEEVTGYKIVEDEKLFEKYNPLLAGCIAQNRNVMCRDIVALILNLINRGKINLRIVPDESIKDIGYRYMISENKESYEKLDLIEKEVYDWIFEKVPLFISEKEKYDYIYVYENTIEIDLIKRIKDISKSDDTFVRIKEINSDTQRRLKRIGANHESVPPLLKLFNNIFILLSSFLVADHIMKNGLDIVINNAQVLYYMFALIFAISILPVIYIFSLVTFEFIRIMFKSLNQITEGCTGRRLIARSISIFFATLIIMVIYGAFAKDIYIILDILLLGVTCLIVFTDDYMLKHEPQILNDYYNLKRIEKKIIEYSLMKDENVEYIELWNNYYPYSVAFGISIPVNKQMEFIYDNKTKILTPENLEGIYYVCKSYLEEMWNMEFYDFGQEINFEKILRGTPLKSRKKFI